MNGLLISLLHEATGLHPILVELTLKRAPYTYKQYYIPKRNGGRRLIAQPAKETKLIQRWLLQNVFNELPVHFAATAYREGISIADNASAHSANPYLVKADFSNFFNSISVDAIRSYLMRHLIGRFDEVDIIRMAEVCSFSIPNRGLCLSVGAPSSPFLSNAIMYEFDSVLTEWCLSENINYTRYADDLTFSTKRRGVSEKIIPRVKEVLGCVESPKLLLNEEKTVHTSKKFRREVTGLIIDNNEKVSLGRERKREISSLIHRFKLGLMGAEDTYRLQGLLGFSADVEPDFIERMSKKYGQDCLAVIFSMRKPED